MPYAGLPVFAFYKDELETRKSRKVFFLQPNWINLSTWAQNLI